LAALILRCSRSSMAQPTKLVDRVARRFHAAVLFRTTTPSDEWTGTCSPGCSVGTWELLRLLAAKGIEPTEVRFTKRLAENVVGFEAATRTGTVMGTVTIKTKFTSEKIDACAGVTLDTDAEDGKSVPAP